MKVSPNNVDSTSPSCSLKACLNSPGTSLFGSRLSREQHDSRKTSVIDALQGLVAHQNSVSSLLTENKPQQSMGHVIEPPSWATPAKGETRLEVRLSSQGGGNFYLFELASHNILSLSFSLYASPLEGKRPLT